jgi:hypothetical protein
VLGAVDRMERSTTALRTLCAALDRGVFPYFERAEDECPSRLRDDVFGTDDGPVPISTVHHGFSLDVRRGRAFLSTRLTHRYEPYQKTDPRRLTIRARLLLVRDAMGVWRLATLEPVLPLLFIDDRRPLSNAQLERLYRAEVAEAADVERLKAQREAATVPGDAPPPCAAPTRFDPSGDVAVRTYGRARDQAAHADVDIAAFGASGRCVVLDSSAPLPARFELELSAAMRRELVVTVIDGNVVVEDASDLDAEPKPLRGLVAHLETGRLVLALPVALRGPVTATLSAERSKLEFSDEVAT